jgi:hypothetical protein
MLVELLYPITGETLYNRRPFCVQAAAQVAGSLNAPDSI